MPRKSAKAIQAAFEHLLNEQRDDRALLTRMKSHGAKVMAELESRRAEALAEIDQEALRNRDAVEKLFADLTAQEVERQKLLDEHLKSLESGEAGPGIGHNSEAKP